MRYNNLGKIIFNNQEFSEEQVRKSIDLCKCNLKKYSDKKEIIAVAVNRNEKYLFLIMALIEKNITFLPIDITLPGTRIQYMLQNADVKTVVVSNEEQKNIFGNYEYVTIDSLLAGDYARAVEDEEPSYENPVYCLYTSGSTGNPKAVVVTYKGFCNFLDGFVKKIPFTKGEKIACFTTICFDIFFVESVLALISGLTVVLVDEETQNNPRKSIDIINTHKISYLQLTPSRFKLFLMQDKEGAFLNSIKVVMIGGEAFPKEALLFLKEHSTARIFNVYGPTETTIWSTVAELTDCDEINIGTPIQNTNIYILKDRQEKVPDGEIGEICIGGDGLAEGYLNRPDLTEQSFINLPFAPFERIYCTGDLGKINKDGNYECYGRIDNQIKIRGYRIETEEIEHTLKTLTFMKEAYVCPDMEKQNIIAFCIFDDSKNANEDEQYVRFYIKQILPDYMLPSKIIEVDSFILTPSGKIDRNAMLSKYLSSNGNKSQEEGSTENEKKIYKIIREELQLDQDITLSAETKVEELGLQSLSYMNIIVNLEDLFDIEFDDEYLQPDSFTLLSDLTNYIGSKCQ